MHGAETDAQCTFRIWTSDLVHCAEICMICDGGGKVWMGQESSISISICNNGTLSTLYDNAPQRSCIVYTLITVVT